MVKLGSDYTVDLSESLAPVSDDRFHQCLELEMGGRLEKDVLEKGTDDKFRCCSEMDAKIPLGCSSAHEVPKGSGDKSLNSKATVSMCSVTVSKSLVKV